MRTLAPMALTVALAVVLTTPSPAQADERGLDTTYQQVVTAGGRIMLQVGKNRSFFMTKSTYNKYKLKLQHVYKRNAKIHVVYKKYKGSYWVKSISQGWKGKKREASRVLREIGKCESGDRVVVNGTEYLFLSRNKTHLRVSPVTEEGFSGDETRIAIRTVKRFKILPREEESKTTVVQDELRIMHVKRGDMVRLFLGKNDRVGIVGAVDQLNPKFVTFRKWSASKGQFLAPRRYLRSKVTRVRSAPLTSHLKLDLGGKGTLYLKVTKTRRDIEGPLEFKAECYHDIKGAILTKLALKFSLSERVAGSYEASDAEESYGRTPALFADKKHKFTFKVIGKQYVDGHVSLLKHTLVTYDQEAARPHLMRVLETANLDEIKRIYLGIGSSKDSKLVRLLINRSLFPPSRAGEDPDAHAEAARAGVKASKQLGASLMLEDILTPGKSLKLTILVDGKVEQENLPRKLEAHRYKRMLLIELSSLEGTLTGDVGRQLFDLYCSPKNKLGAEIEEAFARQPGAVIGDLFKQAFPPKAKKKDADPARVKRAKDLIRTLGKGLIPHLEGELTRRGVPTAELKKEREKYGDAQPDRVIRKALELAEGAVEKKREQILDRKVEAALVKAGEGRHSEALHNLRAVLSENAEHPRAKEALPGLLVSYADRRLDDGFPGQAAEFYEEARELGKTEVSAKLAELYLAGLKVELEGVIIRRFPNVAATKVKKAPKGLKLEGEQAKRGWLKVSTSDGEGFVRKACVKGSGGTYTVENKWTPDTVFLEESERIKELDDTLGPQVDKVVGTHYGNLAQEAYDKGRYDEVGPLLEKVEKLAPDDERLGLSGSAWFKSNMFLLLGLGIVLALGGGGFLIMYLRTRPKKEATAADDASLKITLFTDAIDGGAGAAKGPGITFDSGEGGEAGGGAEAEE